MESLRLSKYIVILMALLISGCTNMHSDFGWAKPAEFDMEPPPGPPIYQQGYRDGCSSGFSGYANNFNKMFWKWKQDPKLAQDKVYYQIWKDAYAYCALWGMMADEHGLGNWR